MMAVVPFEACKSSKEYSKPVPTVQKISLSPLQRRIINSAYFANQNESIGLKEL
jgi:hypothetical protein